VVPTLPFDEPDFTIRLMIGWARDQRSHTKEAVMDRRQLLRFFGVGIGAGLSGDRSAQPPPSAPLAVRIVPTSNTEKLGPGIELYGPEQHFHVVITNASGGPIRLWREWCRWGYFNLAFVVAEEGSGPSR
jgi:hypothetical protein